MKLWAVDRMCKENFEDLQVVTEDFKPVLRPIIWRPFKVFPKLHERPFLRAVIVKGAVSGLRHFLATESPWKRIKNAVYFILKVLFVLKILKFSLES